MAEAQVSRKVLQRAAIASNNDKPRTGKLSSKRVAFLDQCVLIPRDYLNPGKCEATDNDGHDTASADLESLAAFLACLSIYQSRTPWSCDAFAVAKDPNRRLLSLRSIERRTKRCWSTADFHSLKKPECDFGNERTAPHQDNSSSEQQSSSRSGSESVRHSTLTPVQAAGTRSFSDNLASPVFIPPSGVDLASPSPASSPSTVSRSDRTMAAPRAAYRPLSLGSPVEDDEDEIDVAPLPPNRAMIHSPVPRVKSPSTSISVERRPSLLRRRSSTDFGPPVLSQDPFERILATHANLPDVAATRKQGSLRRSLSAPQLSLDQTKSSLAPVDELLSSALSAQASDHDKLHSAEAERPTAHRRKASWFRRHTRKQTEHQVPVVCASGEDDNAQLETIPVLAPLHSECSCKSCSGRIAAGRAPGYVAHWSKQARAKWLADRKQAEMSITSSIPATATSAHGGALNLTNGPPGLVLRNVEAQRFIGQPPVNAASVGRHVPAAADKKLPSRSDIEATLLEVATADAEAAVEPSHDVVAEAGADLQRILSGDGSQGDEVLLRPAPSVQVDEVDQKHGEVRRPSGMGSTAANLEASVQVLCESGQIRGTPSPCYEDPDWMRLAHNGTPVGVGADESMSMDEELRRQVELNLHARAQRRRSDQMIRRGGARAMMAQLEEADRREETANRQRVARRVSDQSEGEKRDSGVATSPQSPSRPMGAYTPPPAGDPFVVPRPRAQSPAMQAPRRTSSPLLDRIKGAMFSSQHGQPTKESPSNEEATTGHRRSTSLSRPHLHHSSSVPQARSPSPLAGSAMTSLGAAVGQDHQARATNVMQSPSPSWAQTPSIPEEALVGAGRPVSKQGLAGQAPSGNENSDQISKGLSPSLAANSQVLRTTLRSPTGLTMNASAANRALGRTMASANGVNGTASSQIQSQRRDTGVEEPGVFEQRGRRGLQNVATEVSPVAHMQRSSQDRGATRASRQDKGTTPSTSSSSSSSPSVEEDVHRRLKRRSLQRRLSAPLNVAKGLFKHG